MRALWIDEHTPLWQAGWLVWHAAAILLLALFVVLSLRFRERAPVLSRLALVLAAAGLAADLAAETLLLMLQPDVAFGVLGVGRAAALLFLTYERVAVLLTGYLGNGLYTIAGIMLTWAGRKALPRWLLRLSIPLWGAGLFLSFSSTSPGSGPGVATAILMPLFVVWAFGVGRWLARGES